jgi:hypothetical protein
MIHQGCSSNEGINSTTQMSDKAIKTPISLSMTAIAYRRVCGKWPNSMRDVNNFLYDCHERAYDQNLKEIEKAIIFEELSDGRLKIISLDISLPFTTIVEIPTTVDIPSDSNTPPSNVSPCCNEKEDNQ